MKRNTIVFVFLIMLFALVGCEKATTTPTTEVPTTVVTTKGIPVFSGVQDVTVIRGITDFSVLTGITANDFEDGVLTTQIMIVDNPVKLDTVGEYTVKLSVKDSDNNVVQTTFKVTVDYSEAEKVLMADMANFELKLDSKGNYVLPKKATGGSSIKWSSSNEQVVNSFGYVVRPGIGEEAINLVLEATFTYSKISMTSDYNITIEPNPEVNEITSSVLLPFDSTSEEYIVEDQAEVKIFYADNGALPYIDVETYINLINGAIQSDIIEITIVEEDLLRVEYSVEYEDFDGSIKTEVFWAQIDFTENTFTVNNFSFFENYVAETSSDYGEGLNYIDADYVDGQAVTIPLGFYSFDFVIHQEGETTYYLMPFHVANLLFAGGLYYDVYYNGDKLWGIDTFTINSGDEEATEILTNARTSSLNVLNAPLDIKWASYNFLALAADYFYGLRGRFNVESYYEILSSNLSGLVFSTDENMYKSVFKVAYGLDDLHTSHVFPGVYEKPYEIGLSISDVGPKTRAFYEGLWDIQDLLEAKYNGMSNYPELTLLDGDKTAVIHLQGFDIDTPDAVKALLDSLPATVENVVIDLSYNTGGNLGAVLRIFGYMTEEPIMYHSQNPADGAAVTYYIESDYVAYNYNWFILASSVTFSAANLMISMAKEQGIATVIGQNSSGGASSIGSIYLPNGSCLSISTNNVLSTRINIGEEYDYLSIEDGIEVEYEMDDVTDDDELIQVINSIVNAE